MGTHSDKRFRGHRLLRCKTWTHEFLGRVICSCFLLNSKGGPQIPWRFFFWSKSSKLQKFCTSSKRATLTITFPKMRLFMPIIHTNWANKNLYKTSTKPLQNQKKTSTNPLNTIKQGVWRVFFVKATEMHVFWKDRAKKCPKTRASRKTMPKFYPIDWESSFLAQHLEFLSLNLLTYGSRSPDW